MGNSFMPIALQQVLYGSGVGIVYDVNAVKAALKWVLFSLGVIFHQVWSSQGVILTRYVLH